MSLYRRFPGQAWLQYELFSAKVRAPRTASLLIRSHSRAVTFLERGCDTVHAASNQMIAAA